MSKRVLSYILICLLLFSIIPFNAYATENTIINQEIIFFDDGSSLSVILSEFIPRATSTKTGRNTYIYRNSDGIEQWRAVLTATFTYTGAASTCTNASCTVTITDTSQWYEVSKYTSISANSATTELTMGQKILGVTINKHEYTLTLTCDVNGALS